MTSEKGPQPWEDQVEEILKRNRVNGNERDPFPLPRIEAVARSVLHDLEILDGSIIDIKERTKVEPDVLLGIKRNNKFISEKIIPLVVNLMGRTGRAMYMTDSRDIAYSTPDIEHESDKDRSDNNIVTLIVFDEYENRFIRNDSHIQHAWDRSDPIVRKSLRMFAGYNFQDILGIFKGIVNEYTNGDGINQ